MDGKDFPFLVLAYYYLGSIADPEAEVARHKEFFEGLDVKCRIYISEQGINGQMSASEESAFRYMEWIRSDARFRDIDFKIHGAKEHAFPKAAVRTRKQLVALDRDVDLKRRGCPLSPQEWKRMLEEKDSDTVLIDVRNSYEWKVGHFEGAELPPCETFRQFPEYARKLKESRDPKRTKVLMYCTGGIRCEFYSALMKEEGFEQVFQLEGGVIGYGLQEGDEHWRGKLFVFDDRLAVPIGEGDREPIGECRHCKAPEDVYYNCANVDCNELFISCTSCYPVRKGCCSEACQLQPRVRPCREDGSSRPFRRGEWRPS